MPIIRNDQLEIRAPKPIRTTDTVGPPPLFYPSKDFIPTSMRYIFMTTTDELGIEWQLIGGIEDVNWTIKAGASLIPLNNDWTGQNSFLLGSINIYGSDQNKVDLANGMEVVGQTVGGYDNGLKLKNNSYEFTLKNNGNISYMDIGTGKTPNPDASTSIITTDHILKQTQAARGTRVRIDKGIYYTANTEAGPYAMWFDSTDPTLASKIFVSYVLKDSGNPEFYLFLLSAGDIVSFIDPADSNNIISATISAPFVQQSGALEAPLSEVTVGGAVIDGTEMNLEMKVVAYVPDAIDLLPLDNKWLGDNEFLSGIVRVGDDSTLSSGIILGTKGSIVRIRQGQGADALSLGYTPSNGNTTYSTSLRLAESAQLEFYNEGSGKMYHPQFPYSVPILEVVQRMSLLSSGNRVKIDRGVYYTATVESGPNAIWFNNADPTLATSISVAALMLDQDSPIAFLALLGPEDKLYLVDDANSANYIEITLSSTVSVGPGPHVFQISSAEITGTIVDFTTVKLEGWHFIVPGSSGVVYKDKWVQQHYDLNDMAQINGWTGIVIDPAGTANPLQPVITGGVRDNLDGAVYDTTLISDTDTYATVTRYTAQEDVYIDKAEFQVPPDTTSRLYIVTDPLGTPVKGTEHTFTAGVNIDKYNIITPMLLKAGEAVDFVQESDRQPPTDETTVLSPYQFSDISSNTDLTSGQMGVIAASPRVLVVYAADYETWMDKLTPGGSIHIKDYGDDSTVFLGSTVSIVKIPDGGSIIYVEITVDADLTPTNAYTNTDLGYQQAQYTNYIVYTYGGGSSTTFLQGVDYASSVEQGPVGFGTKILDRRLQLQEGWSYISTPPNLMEGGGNLADYAIRREPNIFTEKNYFEDDVIFNIPGYDDYLSIGSVYDSNINDYGFSMNFRGNTGNQAGPEGYMNFKVQGSTVFKIGDYAGSARIELPQQVYINGDNYDVAATKAYVDQTGKGISIETVGGEGLFPDANGRTEHRYYEGAVDITTTLYPKDYSENYVAIIYFYQKGDGVITFAEGSTTIISEGSFKTGGKGSVVKATWIENNIVVLSQGLEKVSNKVEFKQLWSDSLHYDLHDMAEYRGYTGVVINSSGTDESLAPEDIGLPYNLYQGTGGTQKQVTTKSLVYGQRINPSVDGYVIHMEMDMVAGNEYEVYTVEDPLGVALITQIIVFTATEDGIFTLPTKSRIINAGQLFDIVIQVNEPDPASVDTLLNYNYIKPTNATTPVVGEITHASKETELLHIHHTDADGLDNSTYFQSLSVGDTLELSSIKWSIQQINPKSGYTTFIVAPAQRATESGLQSFTFSSVTATPISYLEDVDYYLGDPEVQGLYSVDGYDGNATITEHAYGNINLHVQNVTRSDDWYIISSPGESSGAGSGSAVNLLPLDNTWTGTNRFEDDITVKLGNGITLEADGVPNVFLTADDIGFSLKADIGGFNFLLRAYTVTGFQGMITAPLMDGQVVWDTYITQTTPFFHNEIVPTIELTKNIAYYSNSADIAGDEHITPKVGKSLKSYYGAGTVTITLKEDSEYSADAVNEVTFIQEAAGQIEFIGFSGVTVVSAETYKTRKAGSFVTAIWKEANRVYLTGDLELL